MVNLDDVDGLVYGAQAEVARLHENDKASGMARYYNNKTRKNRRNDIDDEVIADWVNSGKSLYSLVETHNRNCSMDEQWVYGTLKKRVDKMKCQGVL